MITETGWHIFSSGHHAFSGWEKKTGSTTSSPRSCMMLALQWCEEPNWMCMKMFLVTMRMSIWRKRLVLNAKRLSYSFDFKWLVWNLTPNVRTNVQDWSPKSLDPWKCWLIPKECNNGSISGLLGSQAFTTNVRRTYEPVTGLENPLQPGQDEMELYLHIFRAGGDFAPSNILSLVNDPIGFSHCEPCRVGSPFSLLWFLVTLGKDPLAALPKDGPWQEVLWPGLEP